MKCQEFYNILYSCLDKFVPLNRRATSKYPVWYTPTLIKNLKMKNKFRKLQRNSPSLEYLYNFKIYRATTKRQIADCFKAYIIQTENSLASNPRHFWQYINRKK